MHEVFWQAGWPQIISIIVAVIGGIVTAMSTYSFLHSDLRTMDGLPLSRRENWRHILGILAFFILGVVVFGGISVAFFHIVGS